MNTLRLLLSKVCINQLAPVVFMPYARAPAQGSPLTHCLAFNSTVCSILYLIHRDDIACRYPYFPISMFVSVVRRCH